ncbi:unnamed protein product [Rotaria magnacalcarata]|uniref:ABC transmembrane type-1 domain-containing protein n=3 Tax=Rotaria magnacalcarata TaxID=392030 RepID=A0A8S2IX95_9BILA|nr:unnamed protein product [Rotaria magnacalcarata]CAF3974138.1 unnamed protein product [Rotaria magnacalcarata]
MRQNINHLVWNGQNHLGFDGVIFSFFHGLFQFSNRAYKQTLTIDNLDQLPTDDTTLILMQKILCYDWKTISASIAIIQIFWKELAISVLHLLPYMFAGKAVPLILRQIALLITGHQTSSSLSACMINLVGTDATRFFDCSMYFHFLWEAPIEFLSGLYLIYSIIGFLPALCGYLLFIFVILVQIICSRTLSEYHDNIAKCADKRIQVLSEMTNAFHIVKMNNWEDLTEKRVNSMREHEFSTIRKTYLIRALNMGLFVAATLSISLATIGYIWLTNGSVVSIDIFTAISFYGVIRTPVASYMPIAIEKTLHLRMTVKRIDELLQQSEQQTLEPSNADQYQ